MKSPVPEKERKQNGGGKIRGQGDPGAGVGVRSPGRRGIVWRGPNHLPMDQKEYGCVESNDR